MKAGEIHHLESGNIALNHASVGAIRSFNPNEARGAMHAIDFGCAKLGPDRLQTPAGAVENPKIAGWTDDYE